MDDQPAVAVEDAAQVVKRPADVQVREVDVPVVMRTAGLVETLPLPLVARRGPPQPVGRLQHPIHRGRAGRYHVVVEHHKRQPPVALQRVPTLVFEDALPLLVRQPVIAGNRGVVLVDPPVTLPPVVELRQTDPQPEHQHADGDLGLR